MYYSLLNYSPVRGHLGNFQSYVDQVSLQLIRKVLFLFLFWPVYYPDRFIEVGWPIERVKVYEILLDIAKLPSTMFFLPFSIPTKNLYECLFPH